MPIAQPRSFGHGSKLVKARPRVCGGSVAQARSLLPPRPGVPGAPDAWPTRRQPQHRVDFVYQEARRPQGLRGHKVEAGAKQGTGARIPIARLALTGELPRLRTSLGCTGGLLELVGHRGKDIIYTNKC